MKTAGLPTIVPTVLPPPGRSAAVTGTVTDVRPPRTVWFVTKANVALSNDGRSCRLVSVDSDVVVKLVPIENGLMTKPEGPRVMVATLDV